MIYNICYDYLKNVQFTVGNYDRIGEYEVETNKNNEKE